MSAEGAVRKLKVAVMRDRYPTSFCTPRISRHELRSSLFIPTHRLSHKLEGVTLIDSRGCDLIHTVNRIPLGTSKPFLISFESHLPRYFGGELTRLFAFERQCLAAPRCRGIIAYSECAKKAFLETHRGTAEFDGLATKLEVVYPNINLPEWNAEPTPANTPLKLVFVGAHFGRKGGAVTARAAQIARERKLPMHFHIVSALTAGGGIWSDPKRQAFFEPYFKLLQADNVTLTRLMHNEQVLQTMRAADFTVLATLSDTFGFSALESLTVGTPVIATPQGALPEFIADGTNGIMLPLEVDPMGEWVYVGRSDKDSRRFESLYQDAIETLANALIDRVARYCDDRMALRAMRANARETAEALFDTRMTSPRLDLIYDKACHHPQLPGGIRHVQDVAPQGSASHGQRPSSAPLS